jgi:hypothetical protein
MRARPGDVLETTLDSDSNFAEIEKVLVIEEVSFRLDEFHAVRIPRGALEASTVIKF